jgi:hypothetical protein
MSSLPSLLVACKYSDLARWYILQLTFAVAISSRYCLNASLNSATVVFVEACRSIHVAYTPCEKLSNLIY